MDPLAQRIINAPEAIQRRREQAAREKEEREGRLKASPAYQHSVRFSIAMENMHTALVRRVADINRDLPEASIARMVVFAGQGAILDTTCISYNSVDTVTWMVSLGRAELSVALDPTAWNGKDDLEFFGTMTVMGVASSGNERDYLGSEGYSTVRAVYGTTDGGFWEAKCGLLPCSPNCLRSMLKKGLAPRKTEFSEVLELCLSDLVSIGAEGVRPEDEGLILPVQ